MYNLLQRIKLWILPTQCVCVFRTVLTKTAIVSLNSSNRLGFAAETWCVSCEVRTESLYNIHKKKQYLVFRGLKAPRAVRVQNMMSPVGLGTKNYCTGEGQQQFSSESSVVLLGSRKSAELVPEVHIALHASHVVLPTLN
jgi:hypothetical protein